MLTISAATMPAPSTPSGTLDSTSTTSTVYAKLEVCYSQYVCTFTCPDGTSYTGSRNALITCYYATTYTYYIVYSWTAPTTASASGATLAPEVQVVESTSCTGSSWTVLATVADSTGSYTVSSPSAAEYYAIRTFNGSTWTGPTTSCTQG